MKFCKVLKEGCFLDRASTSDGGELVVGIVRSACCARDTAVLALKYRA